MDLIPLDSPPTEPWMIAWPEESIDGWRLASGYFTRQGPTPADKAVQVMSNYYGVNSDSSDGTAAIARFTRI
jgi:hypothetical protein